MPPMTTPRMTRRLSRLVNLATAAAVAAAAVTAGPAPAAAGGKDVARRAALIALLAIGAGLYQQQANARTSAAPVARALPPEPEPRYFRPAPQRVDRSPRPVANPVWRDARWFEPPAPHDRQGPRIPAVCAVEIDGRQPATIYADSCLMREGFTYALPQHCAQTIRSNDWSGRIYDGACLRDAGFRTDRRW